MPTIELTGHITEDGKLEVDLPEGLPVGDVKVTIELPTLRRSLLGLWADLGPAPSAEDIDEARREAWANFPRDDIGWPLNSQYEIWSPYNSFEAAQTLRDLLENEESDQ